MTSRERAYIRRDTPALPPKDLCLDLVYVRSETLGDRYVVIYNAVHDRVHDRRRTPAQQVGLALQPLAYLVQLGGLAATDGDNETGPHECVNLAELDRLRFVPVTC